MIAPQLETARLILRAHHIGDIDRLVALYSSARARYLGGPLSHETVSKNFASDMELWGMRGFGCWAIVERSTGVFAGQVGLTHPSNYPEPELGWLIFDEFEGLGYAFEAAAIAKDYAFGELKWPTFVSYIDPDNARSIKLAQRLGATLDLEADTPDGGGCLVFRHRA